MTLRRIHCRIVACLVAVVLVFAHTAALAYACKLESATVASSAAQPCPAHLDSSNNATPAADGNLCKVHCDAATPSDAGAQVAVAAPSTVDSWVPRVRAMAVPIPLHGVAHGTAPPLLLLRTSRLLI